MSKCLSCGHLRHDLELNCPKCGSFYSTIADGFSTDDLMREQVSTLTKIKMYLNQPKHRLIAIGVMIFLAMMVLFL